MCCRSFAPVISLRLDNERRTLRSHALQSTTYQDFRKYTSLKQAAQLAYVIELRKPVALHTATARTYIEVSARTRSIDHGLRKMYSGTA